ncbi:MAG: hypothetical protein KJ947_11550 [Alphaproteobacteria bacterium]|nr:hypothetical protein [Alphaproteobacteria bacterium]MBU1550191.1 hypothetical protein [Alphaproteobacteria bacterium]MBU2337888.1 hypothetical protein [Alphaproteobacteria bacterium]MBU2387868.1 hypothetical protein [Alphaproteobacteria bacterium]
MEDVPTCKNTEGMRDPQELVYGSGGFVDRYLVSLNFLIIEDLKNMGLLEARGGRPTGIVAFGSNGPTNLPMHLHFTAKGELLYEHIFPFG